MNLGDIKNFPLNSFQGLIFWKDKNLNYLGANAFEAQMVGYFSPEKMIGISDYDLNCKACESAETFRSQDRKVLKGKTLKILNIQSYFDGKKHAFLMQKSPIIDNSGQITGVLAIGQEVTNIDLNRQLHKLSANEAKYGSLSSHSKIISDVFLNLSEKETQTLYFLVHGLSAKQIAAKLYKSPRTIEHRIRTLREKLGCANKAELIRFSVEHGFLNIIPDSIVTALPHKSSSREFL